MDEVKKEIIFGDQSQEISANTSNENKINGNKNNINTNIENNSHNTTNITINVYGHENMEAIIENNYAILKRGFYAPVHYIEKLHFSKEYPENNNVYMNNVNDSVHIFDGEKEVLKDRNEVISEMRTVAEDFIVEEYERLEKNIEKLHDISTKIGMSNFVANHKLNENEKDRIKIIKKCEKQLRYLLVNMRALPKERIKKYKQNKTEGDYKNLNKL